MKYTVSLKDNRIFQKLYNRGKRSVSPYFALYYRKNGKKQTRIGITASTKLGKAVVRNRVRRRIREIIRLAEAGISPDMTSLSSLASEPFPAVFKSKKKTFNIFYARADFYRAFFANTKKAR